jgi:hypothetical protein
LRHLTEGALRRLYDEPYALDEQARAHYRDCAECQQRFTSIADDARHTLALMAVPAATVDPQAALARVGSRPSPAPPRLMDLRGRGWRRPALGGLAAATIAAALAATMAFTPLAANLVKIFEPTQVSTVTINSGSGNYQGLDAVSNWADVKWSKQPTLQQVESARDAANISKLPQISVDASKLPTGLSGAPVSYAAVDQSSGTATFTANAPAKLRGSTLTIQAGPAETVVYGDLGKLATAARSAGASAGPDTAPNAGQKPAETGDQPAASARNALQTAGPLLGIAEMRSPQVFSTGASVKDIKNALLAQPGLSPSVRAAINGIDSPTGYLPIPVLAGQTNVQDVKVQGVKGIAAGDSTGLGAAVIWIKNGRVYGVAGTFTQDQILAVANSLKDR